MGFGVFSKPIFFVLENKNKNALISQSVIINYSLLIFHLINSTFWASSAFTLSKKPCSLIHSSLKTLLM